MRIKNVIGEILEHPIIENMERTGWTNGYDPIPCTCPNCEGNLGTEDRLLDNGLGDILGCIDGCIDEIVPDAPRICEICGELVSDDDAIYVNAVNGDCLGCSLCCLLVHPGERK